MNAIATPATTVELEPAGPAATRRRVQPLAFLTIVILGAVGAAIFLQPDRPANAAVPVSNVLREQIATMSTGADQSLVIEGQTAVERNALIPLSSLPVGQMAGFTQISPAAPGYDMALKCLTQAIYYEAANEPTDGKRGVAQVVLNRVRHPAYPNSVCGVVYEGANARVCQFSFTCDGSLLRSPMARQWGESRRIAAEALAGATALEVGTATNYHADYVVPRWAFTLGKLTQIGHHIFYRLPGSIGAVRAFADRWTGVERIPALDFGRLRAQLAAREDEIGMSPAVDFVPGLTVVPDQQDRHATADVGGRLDMTSTWRMTIPDPAQISDGYRRTVSGQNDGLPPSGAVATGDASTTSLAGA